MPWASPLDYLLEVAKFYLALLAPWTVFTALLYGWFYGWKRDQVAFRKLESENPPRALEWSALGQTQLTMLAVALPNPFFDAFVPFDFYATIGERGVLYYLGTLALGFFIFESNFYWTHRLFHFPRFWRLHSPHHRYRLVTPLVRNANGFGEVLILTLCNLLIRLMPLHPSVPIIIILTGTAWNVLHHLGFEVLPLSWYRMGFHKVFVTSTHHSMHHIEVNCHYGWIFAFWDRLCGTMHPTYEKRLEEVMTKIAVHKGVGVRTEPEKAAA